LIVPRRSVIPEGPIIPTLPVLAAADAPALLEVDSCEFSRTRVRRQIKTLCLERLGRCITRHRSGTCPRSRWLAWFRRSLNLGLLSGGRRWLAWFRYSLNLGLSACRCGLGWLRHSLNLGWFACRPRYPRGGRSPFRWRRLLFFLLRAVRGECERKTAN